MNLTELLSELRENILHDRSSLVGGTSDLLWSDATLIRYINEAHRRFARRGLVLRDANNTRHPEVTSVTLVEDQTEYPLHESVISILSAKVGGTVRDMARTGHSVLDGYVPPDTTTFDSASLETLAPGLPSVFSTDEQIVYDSDGSLTRVTLRVYPAPSADHAGADVALRVVRMPLEDLTAANMKAVPEIPRDHHLEMLDYAAYLALRIVDTDAGNSRRADDFRKMFEAHVMEARKHARRKIFAPRPWGFGHGGFTWES